MMKTKNDSPQFGSLVPHMKDSLLTKRQAAKRLAISTRTLDRLAAQGLLEKVFVGSSVRIRESEVSAIIQNGL